MTPHALIYFARIAFGSFLERAVRGKSPTFVFRSVIGSLLAFALIGVVVAFILGVVETMFDMTFTFYRSPLRVGGL